MCFLLIGFIEWKKQSKIYAIDPGLVKTEIGDKHTKGIALFVWRMRKKGGVDAKIPAKHMVEIALNESYIKDAGGLYERRFKEKLNQQKLLIVNINKICYGKKVKG